MQALFGVGQPAVGEEVEADLGADGLEALGQRKASAKSAGPAVGSIGRSAAREGSAVGAGGEHDPRAVVGDDDRRDAALGQLVAEVDGLAALAASRRSGRRRWRPSSRRRR